MNSQSFTKAELYEVVLAAFKSSVGNNDIDKDTPLNSLNMDSLTRVEVTMEIETEIQNRSWVASGFALPEDYAEGVITLKELVEKLYALIESSKSKV